MPRVLRSAWWVVLGAVALVSLGGCSASRSPDRGSSETHFLRRCTEACGGDLACVCGVCSRACSSDAACTGLAASATCSELDRTTCGGPAEPTAACELTCEDDADCRVLSDDHRCTAGVCRAGAAPAADAGAPPVDAGGEGVACGAATCAPGQRCCNPCVGACVAENAMIACAADEGEVSCDGGAVVVEDCGLVTCVRPAQVCCDKCESLCVPATSGAFCPDDVDPNRSCSEDAGTAECAAQLESCLETECCSGLLCCSGIPIPEGQAICYGGACPMSDRNLKSDIEPVDPDAVLAGVAQLPIARWRYTHDPARAPHIGPMAQDFQAAFAVGEDDRHIFSADGDGVALAAIQALHRRVIELERKQQVLNGRNAELTRELERLRRTRR